MIANKPEDVWKRVDRRGTNECWPYTGSTFSGRYGRFFLAGKAVLAHRTVYQLVTGIDPGEMFVMHKCNNKLCCNPDHLSLGSNSENQRHAACSGAWPPGASGITGVGFDKRRRYWVARGYLNGKPRNLYTGPHKHKAITARKQWERKNGINFQLKGLNNENF